MEHYQTLARIKSFFVDRAIFCRYENSGYKIHKDLMSAVYFPVSKCHLTGNHMKESPNNNYVANVKKH